MPKTNHCVNLTPTKIARLKPAPPGQRYQIMDAVVPGFGIDTLISELDQVIR